MRAIALIFLFALLSASWVSAKEKVDYRMVAEKTDWRWNEGISNALGCIGQSDQKYDISLERVGGSQLGIIIRILLQGREAYHWKGHAASVFQIFHHHLYYAEYSPHSTGGKIVAIDLDSGTELWRTDLQALGLRDHSAYASRLTLEANDDSVVVFGDESFGRYLEIKLASTGKTVGHKIFPAHAADPDHHKQP